MDIKEIPNGIWNCKLDGKDACIDTESGTILVGEWPSNDVRNWSELTEIQQKSLINELKDCDK